MWTRSRPITAPWLRFRRRNIAEGGWRRPRAIRRAVMSCASPGRGAETRPAFLALYLAKSEKPQNAASTSPNRYAWGAASCRRHASGMTMRGGLPAASDPLDRHRVVGVEGQVVLDARHVGLGVVIAPGGVFEGLAFRHDGVIARLALVGTGGAVIGLVEERHGDIAAREIDHIGIARFAQFQRVLAFGKHRAACAYGPCALCLAYRDISHLHPFQILLCVLLCRLSVTSLCHRSGRGAVASRNHRRAVCDSRGSILSRHAA